MIFGPLSPSLSRQPLPFRANPPESEPGEAGVPQADEKLPGTLQVDHHYFPERKSRRR